MEEEQVHVQVKDNSSSIEHILRPITYISWLLGVGVAHPRKCPKTITIIIRIIQVAVCSSILMYDAKLFYFWIYHSVHNDVFIYMDILNWTVCYISIYYYIYYGIRQYSKWPELMDRLKRLDQEIRKEISMNDQFIKIIEALAIFTTFTFWPLWPIIHALYLYLTGFVNIIKINDLLFFYILAQSLINSFVFDIVVYVLYRRFQILNKLTSQLDKLSDVQHIVFKIRRIRELHADVCDLASMVNDIHGLHLLLCSASCFMMAVTTLFTLLMNIWKSIYPFFYTAYAMQFYLICWICTFACRESNKTGTIIHKIILIWKSVNLDHEASNLSSLEVQCLLEDSNGEQNSNCNSSYNPHVIENSLSRNLDRECVIRELNDFSTQLQQNHIAFTAYDFFKINNASFACFIGVIFFYLMIFV
ncbi:uncharacterized protein LOC113004819 [Solenopsis invicta]|uniref:uncharacterized protein LOC113004819 n=1 Tax=Solenopsis invicta TaxID=13686 RepID=UPI00193EC199|nr:uncharacterized protein LOC113004819 [Solenopsis invicta]